jgi:hypothetical protein
VTVRVSRSTVAVSLPTETANENSSSPIPAPLTISGMVGSRGPSKVHS